MDKEEIQDELYHVNKLLKIAHNNRRTLEIQQIQQGMIAPLNLVNQINEVKSSIVELEERKNNLEIKSVETDYSLAEAEYKVIASEEWENGLLSTRGSARLELARLHLKLHQDRAKEIEREVRSSLVKDIFIEKDIRFFWAPSPSSSYFEYIIKSIRLDYKSLVDIIIDNVVNDSRKFNPSANHIINISNSILKTNVLRGNEKDTILKDFIKLLQDKLQEYNLLIDSQS